MIPDAIISLVFGFFTFVTGLLPSFSAPSWVSGSCALDAITLNDLGCPMSAVGQKVGLLSRWVDVSTLATVLGVVMLALVASATVRLVLFIYARIPGKAS